MTACERSLKITFTIGTLGPGGAERVLSILTRYWAERGVKVTIVTLDSAAPSFYRLDPSIKVFEAVGSSRAESMMAFRRRWGLRDVLDLLLPYLFRHALRVREVVRATSPDIVISFVDSANALTLLALLMTRYPRIVSERSDPAMVPLARVWRVLRKLLYPTADAVVVQTRGAAAFFRGLAARKLSVIPNPVLIPASNEDCDVAVRRPSIVAIGRFTEEKRFIDLLNAFALIADRHRDWSLMIVGDGPLRSALMNRVKEMDLGGRVSMPGLTKNPVAVLRRADIFVLCSRFEGFPTVLGEAMALGAPVIATDCPSGPRAMIRDNIDGVLVPPKQPAVLADAIDTFIRSPDLRKRLATAAPAILERFSLDSVAAQWEEVLAGALLKRCRTEKAALLPTRSCSRP